ncbi:GNAT family N-acetyltransferase [Lacinutrix gracilariae]|uniref:GNAT family N-acetyltransferase n=1 Tax=Lacinutrix gracilariae TaxID=1747198 RepID=A0ABW5JYB2_9FLAO
MHLVKTNSENPDFIHLVQQLDAYLKIMDGEEHDFYNQFNNIDVLKNTIVAYIDNVPVGCGAFKEYNTSSVEIKRMYTNTKSRGQGVATKIVQALEDWAKQLGYKKCILETGKRQTEAVTFYKKNNYKIITNYGQYANIENSLCFEKELI